MKCPKCGADMELLKVEVDIGVGVQEYIQGADCLKCGYQDTTCDRCGYWIESMGHAPWCKEGVAS